MNKYIKVKMENSTFKVVLKLKLDGKVYEAKAKIDTGCCRTNMPMRRLDVGITIEDMINDYSLGARAVGINYDRTGNILIGMDILKMLDIHMGNDRNGDFVMLACDKNKLTPEYLQALYDTFGVVKVYNTDIEANHINEMINK